MNNHPSQWILIEQAWHDKHIPQSMLFVGPLHSGLNAFVTELMQLFLCRERPTTPCLHCLDCRMVLEMTHPDITWIKPDKTGGAIKIDQIRELQTTAYLTPQRSEYRVIAIEGADRMNSASANALLKLLEEPPSHTLFILIAQQLSTVLPTVLSRCQLFRFTSNEASYANNLLLLGEHYPEESDRHAITLQSEAILDELIALVEGKQHACILAVQWKSIEISTLLWFLYLAFAQMQCIHSHQGLDQGPAHRQLIQLAALLNPLFIFKIIDKINTILKKIGHNMNINSTLVLEDLFMFLQQVS